MIDLHCHLDLYPDPAAVAERCEAEGLYILSVTTTPSAFDGTEALAKGKSRIRTGLGLHPQLAHIRRGETGLFADLLPRTAYVGEVGLDGSPECRPFWTEQKAVFGELLRDCERAGGRILSLHSRRAATAVLDALEAYPKAGLPVFHWFSGSGTELRRAVTSRAWFSVGPAMLASERGQKLVAAMPVDRVLTETDGPFAIVNGERLMPWDASLAITGLAKVWCRPVEDVRVQLRDNLRRLSSSA